jgi:hypothetical protein
MDTQKDVSSKYRDNLIELKNKVMPKKKKRILARETERVTLVGEDGENCGFSN